MQSESSPAAGSAARRLVGLDLLRLLAVLLVMGRHLHLGPDGAVPLAPAFVFDLETTPFIYTGGLTLFYIGSGMLLTGVILSDAPRGRAATLLAAIGSYSYSIYLWHVPVQAWGPVRVERLLGHPLGFGVTTTIYVVGALTVGIVMAKLVEVPALRLRDRWFPRREQGPMGTTPLGTTP